MLLSNANESMLSFLKKTFYPLFFLLVLLSIFLIEGEYRFYLFALWSVFLLCFSLIFSNCKASKQVAFALVLSALFGGGLIFSRQIPLSIEKTTFYLVSLGIFIFFQTVQKENFKPKLFSYYLAILTLVLNILVLFFTFYKLSQDIFPGMNLLVRNYGHNHYAAFLLLVVPIFWWQLLYTKEQSKETRILMMVLLISSYILIIFSLARLVLLLSLIQLVIIFFTNKKAFVAYGNDELIKVLVKTFIFTLFSIGTVFVFLSLPLGKNGENICPLIFSQKEICKPLLENDRFIYWQKAWLVFKARPILGSGLKNFNFASRQFPLEDQQLTSYAHNIFLHNLAEGGLVLGGSFIFFVIFLFYRSFQMIMKSEDVLDRFLWLAAISSFFNAMFLN